MAKPPISDQGKPPAKPVTARALVLGDRIDPAGLERKDALSASPLAFRTGEEGFVAIFRYGVVVLIGLTPFEEDQVLRGLTHRIHRPAENRWEESALVRVVGGKEDRVDPQGEIEVTELSAEHLLVIADALAKGAALAHDEAQVALVFDDIEPWARSLAEHGKKSGGRQQTLQLIGRALLVQHRVTERVAVAERPDILWDRPDLSRLYARLEDEYELVERAETLNRKLQVIAETATLLTDLIDTERSLRLEFIIVLLIVAEIAITLFQMATGALTH